MSGALVIARYALQEAVRRRVLVVVLVLTLAFLALYALGTKVAFDEVEAFGDPAAQFDERVLTGSTLLGLSMFTTLFLGAGRSAARACCWGASAARRPCAASTWRRCTPRRS